MAKFFLTSQDLDLNPNLKGRFSYGSFSIPASYDQILDSFRALGETEEFSPTQRKRVVETVLACAVVELDLERICALPSETERVKSISRACGVNAEPGFCEGSSDGAVRSVLESRLSTLCNAFDVSRGNDNLVVFFKEAFRGDPCLNGRLAAVQRFAFEQETGLSADLLTRQDACTDHDEIAFKFTELMYGLSFEDPPEKADFERYLRHQADYEISYKPWVESPLFPQLYSRAREFFT